MEVSKDEFSELQIGNSVESFQKFLVSQRQLFHSQIDQLQKIVVTQCKLTGVNPLSQEMAAGALSIKIGKRPRDLLNPKAVNYMQLVFSIKDAISKKESREISALFGVKVTQVREFFNVQRSRVRKQVRLSRERVVISNYGEETRDELPISSDPMIPINPAPLNSSGPVSKEEASCSTPEASFSGLNGSEKHFVDNIFSLMRKEETFSGQVKLLDWILKMQNTSVLNWFLGCGGVMILAAWLNEAAVEEQTSVLLLILKVLCHLPLHKALPTHISATLQCVNRLRFHKTSDISNRARVLLSKWSKLLVKNQAINKTTGVKPGCEDQKMVGQRLCQIMGTESWNSNVDIPEDILALSYEGSDDFRKSEAPQNVKLLTASSDDSTKKSVLGLSLSQTRERRKVQLVEQPGQKEVGRSPQVVKVGPVSKGRPMSADDIQKAKMRALFMQSKYGKPGSSKGSKEARTDGLNKPQTNQAGLGVGASLSKAPVSTRTDEGSKPLLLPSKTSNTKDVSSGSYSRMDLMESVREKYKQVQIPWKTPAEVRLHDTWRVGAGENSKEADVQKSRNRRGEEVIYRTIQEISLNPNEPWDLEMDYDDSLTPPIPIEQLPDADGAEALAVANAGTQVATPSSSNSNANVAEPDLELLAVLLKNPELVFALTSGQGGIPSAETVKLLDMIKRGGVHLPDNTIGGIGGEAQEKVEVSLPSPTPSNDPRTSGWTTEVAKNPFSRHNSVPDRGISFPAAVNNMVLPAAHGMAIRQHQNDPLPLAPNVSALSSVHPTTQMLAPNIGLSTTMNDIIPANASSVLAMRVDNPNISTYVKPIANLRIQEGFSKSHMQSYELPSPTPTPAPTLSSSVTPPQRHTHLLQQPHIYEPSSYNSRHAYLPPMEKQGHVSESWRVRQDISSSYHSQVNQNAYNTSNERPKRSGSSWERNDYGGGGGGGEFESWSPDNSPSRNNGYVRGRGFPGARMNPGRNYRPELSRHRGSSGYWDPNNRQGSRKWHD